MSRESTPPPHSSVGNSAFARILEKYRQEARSERDKGSKFEALIQRYLRTDPQYASLKNVWLWNEFPFRKDFGGKDTGIDLVAETEQGDFWAIQCKCYAEDAHLSKADLDSFLSTSGKKFKNENLKTVRFAHRLWIATTRDFGAEFENTIRDQDPPVSCLGLTALENAPVDWNALDKGNEGERSRSKRKKLRSHQETAVKAAHEYFKNPANTRGKLIMACGTGKTFTALKIAEKETGGRGLVLCLVPSIALVGQMLREWTADAEKKINAICVCSDAEVSSKKSKDADEMFDSVENLALPATTDPKRVAEQIAAFTLAGTGSDGLTVIFSTYHSSPVISEAQKKVAQKYGNDKAVFNLIVCDEAHRTTGFELPQEKASAFTSVHEEKFLAARRRIYMTATPRLYADESKKKAAEKDVKLWSMDDPDVYGEEIYRIGFGEAVEKNLLADYKVLVFTISESEIPKQAQHVLAKGEGEIPVDDWAKLVGCINALSKQMLLEGSETLINSDPEPMRRAVAFCSSIKVSKKLSAHENRNSLLPDSPSIFEKARDFCFPENASASERKKFVKIETDHIDGSMGAGTRDEKLAWLKEETPAGTCRVLSNVRCLSEGVDVPALDAVLFLSARNSQIDVVQSVGRVMRNADGKKYGYIIVPVVIPADISAEEALDKNPRFNVVWSVLNALRAHDDRFDATIHKIEFNKTRPSQILVGGTVRGNDGAKGVRENFQNLALAKDLFTKIYITMPTKVGDRDYWERWAKDVGEIALRNIARIKKLISTDSAHKKAFDEFVRELRQNINPSIDEAAVVEMLAQHIVTQPVFDALFENHAFTEQNAISKSMARMLALLEENAPKSDFETLEKFYESVRKRASGIDSAEGRQRLIIELYDKFFKTAFPKIVEKLGIVYTPVEVVDFLVRSVEVVLKKEFGRSIADNNVHILDPFTGTGTFITRLLQSGIIPKNKLLKKFRGEIHANEIVLLAYYIACINIENAFAELAGTTAYEPFQGACLTDTFQLGEPDNASMLFKMFPENSQRVRDQKNTQIRVILGNPPYSVGQKSANDNAQNESYPHLEEKIAETYAAETKATNKNALYDSYVKAFRWASDRIDPKNGGVIAFVTNAGWLDANAMDGFRKCLEKEFSAIYVFNLRGNQRTSGELSRKEGGKIFGSGSRTPVAMTILVKQPAGTPSTGTAKARIFYRDIGDYLTREQKLEIIEKAQSLDFADGEHWEILSPNAHGDWINQRNDKFSEFIPLAPEKKFDAGTQSFFVAESNGVKTQRDAFAYNFSRERLAKNMKMTIDFYNEERKRIARERALGHSAELTYSDSKISWTRALQQYVSRGKLSSFDKNAIVPAQYRPFCSQYLYFDRMWNEMVYQIPKFFPTREHENVVICVSGASVIITDVIADLHFNGDTQCFPLYYYEPNDFEERGLFDSENDEAFIRRDGVSNFILRQARELYGTRVSKEDIFYYVYGLLHSPDYRREFASDLKKMLPRLPLVESPKDFWAFSKAGRELADLHLNYETVPLPRDILATHYGAGTPNYRVEKMKFESGKKARERPDKILYNDAITVGPVPAEAYDYVVNGKSAIEWVMERYAVTTHKESGIVNDPNLWCEEHDDPAYIVNLLRRVIDLSRKSIEIIKKLPKLKFS